MGRIICRTNSDPVNCLVQVIVLQGSSTYLQLARGGEKVEIWERGWVAATGASMVKVDGFAR